jgi:hypothetical protein
MCAVCKQGVPKETMTYQKGRVFHIQCFESQGSTFPVIDSELAQMSARTRIELVQMKNLKARSDAEEIMQKTIKPKKKAIAKKSKKSKKTSRPKKFKAKKSKKKAKRRR